MLSDHERATLLDIEHRLLVEDPGWTMAFDATGLRVPRQRAFELTFHIVAMMVSMTLAGLMLAAHAPGPALFFAVATGLLIWQIRRLRGAAETPTGVSRADTSDPGGSGARPRRL